MTPHARGNLDRLLSELSSLAPDSARTARTRARAHARFATRRRATTRVRERVGFARRILRWIATAAIVPARRENG